MKKANLVRPLTKRKLDGELYTRRPRIEAAINSALEKDLSALLEQARISNPKDQNYLPCECLVYFVRDAMRRGNDDIINALTPILFARCNGILQREPSEEVREQVRDKFVDLLVSKESEALDYFEVSFSRAFLLRRYDALRAQTKRRRVFLPLASEGLDDEPDADLKFRSEIDKALVAAYSETGDPVLRNEFMIAIGALPEEERQAVILVYMYGYDEESENPKKVTAARLCNVTGRTIRNRLKSALRKLQTMTFKK